MLYISPSPHPWTGAASWPQRFWGQRSDAKVPWGFGFSTPSMLRQYIYVNIVIKPNVCIYRWLWAALVGDHGINPGKLVVFIQICLWVSFFTLSFGFKWVKKDTCKNHNFMDTCTFPKNNIWRWGLKKVPTVNDFLGGDGNPRHKHEWKTHCSFYICIYII